MRHKGTYGGRKRKRSEWEGREGGLEYGRRKEDLSVEFDKIQIVFASAPVVVFFRWGEWAQDLGHRPKGHVRTRAAYFTFHIQQGASFKNNRPIGVGLGGHFRLFLPHHSFLFQPVSPSTPTLNLDSRPPSIITSDIISLHNVQCPTFNVPLHLSLCAFPPVQAFELAYVCSPPLSRPSMGLC